MHDSLTANRSTALAELHDYFEYQPQPYLELLRHVYTYGYLQAAHLPLLDANSFGTKQSSARYLTELKRLGLVTTKPRSLHCQPLIYHTTSRGMTYLKTRKNPFPVHEHRHESIKPAQLAHALAVTDVMAIVTAWAATEPSLTVNELDRRLFQSHHAMMYTVTEYGQRRTKRLIPDFQSLLLRQRDDLLFPFQFYFEIERGGHSMKKVRQKVASYSSWHRQGGERQLAELFKHKTTLNRPAPTYRVGFVVQDRRGNHHRAMARYATHIRRVSLRPRVYLTTSEKVTNALEKRSYAVWYPIESLSDPHGDSDRARYDHMETQLRQVAPIPLIPANG